MAKLNIKNRTIFCSDNLEVLENINSETIDLIYLDPPFNKKKVFTAPIGSQAEGAEFSDIFRAEDIKDEWVQTIREDNEKLHNFLNGIKNIDGINSYNYCYLCYMAIRLIECHRILKNTGSLYLHCDPTMSHYLKLVLDCIFKEENFRNEIVWHYKKWSNTTENFQKNHDIILRYTKTDKFIFNKQYQKYSNEKWIEKTIRIKNESNKLVRAKDEYGNYIERKKINAGVPMHDVFNDISFGATNKERTGYPTQKPLVLLERILKASSKEGDIVLDPFCGCATTCIASEKLGRQWIGIDVSEKAFELVKLRLSKEIPSQIWDNKTINFIKTNNLKRTDGGGKHTIKKYVYIMRKESELPYYKVGIAKNIKARLSSYKTADKDRDYTMEYSFLATKYRDIEKYIHFKFENLREWVNAKKEDIIFEIENYEKTATGFGEGSMDLKHLTPKQKKKAMGILGEKNIKEIDKALKTFHNKADIYNKE